MRDKKRRRRMRDRETDKEEMRREEKRRAWKDDKAEEKKADNRKELPLTGIEGGLETDDKVKERERDKIMRGIGWRQYIT